MNPEQTTNQTSDINTDATISLKPEQMITPGDTNGSSISYGDVMMVAWNMFTKRVFKLSSLLLIPYIAPFLAIITGFLVFRYIVNDPQLLQSVMLHTYTVGYPPVWLISVVGSILLTFGFIWLVLQNWSMAAITHMTLVSGDMGIRQSYRETKTFLWRFIALILCMGLFVFLYFPLLIVPAIVMSIYFAVAMQVFVAEKTTVKQALLRSFTYIKGNFWSVAGLVATWAIVTMPIGMILDVIIDNSEITGVVFITAIIRFVLSLIFAAFFMCLTTAIYKALRSQKTEINVTTKISYFVYPAIVGLVVWVLLLVVALENAAKQVPAIGK